MGSGTGAGHCCLFSNTAAQVETVDRLPTSKSTQGVLLFTRRFTEKFGISAKEEFVTLTLSLYIPREQGEIFSQTGKIWLE